MRWRDTLSNGAPDGDLDATMMLLPDGVVPRAIFDVTSVRLLLAESLLDEELRFRRRCSVVN